MASYIDRFNDRTNRIDNNHNEKHLLTRIAYLHNKFQIIFLHLMEMEEFVE